MYLVIGIVIVVLLVLIVGVSYLQMQDNKKHKAKIASMSEQSKKYQNQFKEQANKLVELELASTSTKQKFNLLSTNFFVFQTINESNLSYLESLLTLFSNLIELISHTPASDQLKEAIELSANKIPISAVDFSTSFYATKVPLILAELRKSVEGLAEIQEIDDEEQNLETPEDPEMLEDNEPSPEGDAPIKNGS